MNPLVKILPPPSSALLRPISLQVDVLLVGTSMVRLTRLLTNLMEQCDDLRMYGMII